MVQNMASLTRHCFDDSSILRASGASFAAKFTLRRKMLGNPSKVIAGLELSESRMQILDVVERIGA